LVGKGGKVPAAMVLIPTIVFYVGLLLAVVTALWPVWIDQKGLYIGLAIFGLIIGAYNITAKETGPFLFGSVAFIVAALGMQQLISATGVEVPKFLTQLAANITVFVGAGAMLIALRAVYEVAKSR
jgi:hypothetical protein